jgi:hypothetical protein
MSKVGYNTSNHEANLTGNQFFVAAQYDNYCDIRPHSDRKLVREIGLS